MGPDRVMEGSKGRMRAVEVWRKTKRRSEGSMSPV